MAAKKTPASKNTKTAYVLALPADMPAKEVVEKAKAEGIELTEGHVYNIRSAAKAKGAPNAKKAKKALKAPKAGKAPKAKRVASTGDRGAKARFVRAQPATMKANDVVAAAKKAGLTLTASYVYEVRSGAKKAGKGAKKAPVPKGSTRTGGEKPSASSSGSEREFRKLVVALGVERASELLADVKRRLEQVIAGV